MQEKQQLLLVDGSGYIFRAFHALPPMTRKDGTPVNAVYGFTAMLMKLVDDMQPDYVAVVFDVTRKTFRSDIFQSIKPTGLNHLKTDTAICAGARGDDRLGPASG